MNKHTTTFNISDSLIVECETTNTRDGFRHNAILFRNGERVTKTGISYLNRTWESYEYESVLERLASKKRAGITKEESETIAQFAKDYKPGNPLKTVGMAAAMLALLAPNEKEANQSKLRILRAIPGVNVPDNWDSLDEAEKSRRLDGVIKIATEEA